MNYDEMVQRLGGQAFFDFAMVVQLVREDRAHLRTQLYRWVKAGKLLSLRRGIYAWPERYRRVPLNPAELANVLHHPSYLSGLWALGFHGLIPEMVVTYTSVTTRAPRRFENSIGVYEYRHIKPEVFFGYARTEISGRQVLVAEPEKALLDFWHLSKGPWSLDRISEMRFQNFDAVNVKRMRKYVRRFDRPRLIEAARIWTVVAEEAGEGTVTL